MIVPSRKDHIHRMDTIIFLINEKSHAFNLMLVKSLQIFYIKNPNSKH